MSKSILDMQLALMDMGYSFSHKDGYFRIDGGGKYTGVTASTREGFFDNIKDVYNAIFFPPTPKLESCPFDGQPAIFVQNLANGKWEVKCKAYHEREKDGSLGFDTKGEAARAWNHRSPHPKPATPAPTLELCPICGEKPHLKTDRDDRKFPLPVVYSYMCVGRLPHDHAYISAMPTSLSVIEASHAWNALVKAIRGIRKELPPLGEKLIEDLPALAQSYQSFSSEYKVTHLAALLCRIYHIPIPGVCGISNVGECVYKG